MKCPQRPVRGVVVRAGQKGGETQVKVTREHPRLQGTAVCTGTGQEFDLEQKDQESQQKGWGLGADDLKATSVTQASLLLPQELRALPHSKTRGLD